MNAHGTTLNHLADLQRELDAVYADIDRKVAATERILGHIRESNRRMRRDRLARVLRLSWQQRVRRWLREFRRA